MKPEDSLDPVRHIDYCLTKIIEYTYDKSYSDYLEQPLLRHAIPGMMMFVGEHIEFVSDDVYDKYPAPSWYHLVFIKHHLMQRLLRVEHEAVWKEIKNEVPKTEELIRGVMQVENLRSLADGEQY